VTIRPRELKNSGQVLVEGLFAFLLYFVFFVGGAKVFWTQWEKLTCRIELFELTQQKLVGGSVFFTQVSFHETPFTIEGRTSCLGVPESVILPKLEAGRW
jgi:hypothetical protein